jgi:hypothetical protein
VEVCEAYLVKRTEAAVLAGDMRVLARYWGGRVKMTAFLNSLRVLKKFVRNF